MTSRLFQCWLPLVMDWYVLVKNSGSTFFSTTSAISVLEGQMSRRNTSLPSLPLPSGSLVKSMSTYNQRREWTTCVDDIERQQHETVRPYEQLGCTVHRRLKRSR